MTFKHVLQNSGLRPYRREKDRARDSDDEFSYSDYERLLSDDYYCQLAELRWLASELEKNLARDECLADSDVHDEIFDAVANTDAPIAAAVDAYVERWRAENGEAATGVDG
jgi:hypothetical protein